MGLDMYLNKVRKLRDGVTLRQLRNVDEYFGFKGRGEKYKKRSMKEWCGIDYKDVDLELTKVYKPEYIHRYSSWDMERKYGFKTIFQNIAYWRKANQIHKWFVENVQGGTDDCNMYEVEKEQLEDLLSTCKFVKDNPKLANKLLPTQCGFFFGSTEYDEYYMEDIDHTIEALEKVLKETDFDNWVVLYVSSW